MTTNYAYSYENGRVSTSKTNGSESGTYTYDDEGNTKKAGSSTYKNKYNSKKQLTKTVIKGYDSTTIRTFKYEAIKVPSSVAAKVQEQQWSLLNSNRNFALGLA